MGEWETTRKDHSKGKDSIVRRRKLLMAGHNISFVFAIDKEFESLWVVAKNALFGTFLILYVFCSLCKSKKTR